MVLVFDAVTKQSPLYTFTLKSFIFEKKVLDWDQVCTIMRTVSYYLLSNLNKCIAGFSQTNMRYKNDCSFKITYHLFAKGGKKTGLLWSSDNFHQ